MIDLSGGRLESISSAGEWSESDVLFHRPTLVSSFGDIDCGTTTEFFLTTCLLAAKKIHLPPLEVET